MDQAEWDRMYRENQIKEAVEAHRKEREQRELEEEIRRRCAEDDELAKKNKK